MLSPPPPCSLISIGSDTSDPDPLPSKWNLRALFSVAAVLALVALASSLLLLGLLLTSWEPRSLFQAWGLGGVSFGQITTSIYLKVSVSDFLTLFSARTGEDWFWSRAPSWQLLGAAVFALSCSTTLALLWPSSSLDAVPVLGLVYRPPFLLVVYIWIYCLVWWAVQDVCKVNICTQQPPSTTDLPTHPLPPPPPPASRLQVLFLRLLTGLNLFDVNSSGKLVLPESALELRRARMLAAEV